MFGCEDHKKEFEWQRHLLYTILVNQEKQMSALTDLQGSVSKLGTDLNAFIQANSGGATDADLVTLKAQVDALDAQIAPPPVAGS